MHLYYFNSTTCYIRFVGKSDTLKVKLMSILTLTYSTLNGGRKQSVIDAESIVYTLFSPDLVDVMRKKGHTYKTGNHLQLA